MGTDIEIFKNKRKAREYMIYSPAEMKIQGHEQWH